MLSPHNLQFSLIFLVSGSQDKTLLIWDLRTGLSLHVLRGHRTRITCARYDGKHVVSSGVDNLIKVRLILD